MHAPRDESSCMNVIASLHTLVKLKERRLGQLEEVVQQRQKALREQARELDAACDAAARCLADETARRVRIVTASSDPGGFRGSDIVLLQYLVEEAVEHTKAANGKVQQEQLRLAKAQEVLRAAEGARRRGEQQLDRCRERWQSALKEMARAVEDQQDEESEEAAVGRMLMQARRAASESPVAS